MIDTVLEWLGQTLGWAAVPVISSTFGKGTHEMKHILTRMRTIRERLARLSTASAQDVALVYDETKKLLHELWSFI